MHQFPSHHGPYTCDIAFDSALQRLNSSSRFSKIPHYLPGGLNASERLLLSVKRVTFRTRLLPGEEFAVVTFFFTGRRSAPFPGDIGWDPPAPDTVVLVSVASGTAVMHTALVVEPDLSPIAAVCEFTALSLSDSTDGTTLAAIEPSPLFVLRVVVLLSSAWFALTSGVWVIEPLLMDALGVTGVETLVVDNLLGDLGADTLVVIPLAGEAEPDSTVVVSRLLVEPVIVLAGSLVL